MHQFSHTITKIKNSSSYKFKLDKKQCIIDVEIFCEILQICPRLPNQEFDAPLSDEEIVTFIKELGHKSDIKSISNVVIDNRDHKKQEKMYYLRFTKVIIHHFNSKDKSISMRSKCFMHTVRVDSVLGAATPKKARKFKKPASLSKKKTLVVKKAPVKTNRTVDINKTDDEEEDEFVHTLDDYVPTDDEDVDDEEFECINKEMYSDVNVELKDSEREGEEKDDEEITDVEHKNVSQEAAETVFEAGDTQGPHNLGEDTGNTDKPPVVKVKPKDWFKKPEIPPTPDPVWNKGKSVENKPTHKWICDLAKKEKPSKTFNDLMSTPIDFSAFVMNRLQISDLTQDILVGPAYELLKGDRYPFDLSKPLPLVKSGYRQIIPVDYFFNNDLAYLQGESTSRTYMTFLTKTKAAKYDLHEIEDMVPNLWSPIKVTYDKYALLGDFPRFHLNDIEDMLLIVIQNRVFNLEGDVIVHFAAALRMFTRGVIYEDKLNRKRLMHSDELYKFSDDTLQSIWDTLHDMATNLRIGYNKAMPKRIWTYLDKTRSHIMVKEIDRQFQERRLMRSLEKFVGGIYYGEDLKLL
ncbi:hypothetical protein Tco_0970720 [Tanacetum coccineum]